MKSALKANGTFFAAEKNTTSAKPHQRNENQYPPLYNQIIASFSENIPENLALKTIYLNKLIKDNKEQIVAFWVDEDDDMHRAPLDNKILEKIANISSEKQNPTLNKIPFPELEEPAVSIHDPVIVSRIASLFGVDSDLIRHIEAFAGKDKTVSFSSMKQALSGINLKWYESFMISSAVSTGAYLKNFNLSKGVCPFTRHFSAQEMEALKHAATGLLDEYDNFDPAIYQLMLQFSSNNTISQAQFNEFKKTRHIEGLLNTIPSEGEWSQLFNIFGKLMHGELVISCDAIERFLRDTKNMLTEKRMEVSKHQAEIASNPASFYAHKEDNVSDDEMDHLTLLDGYT